MIHCLGPGCGQKIVETDRALRTHMCESCLELARAELKGIGRSRSVSLFPPLYYGDLRGIVQRSGAPVKLLAPWLGIQPVTLRMAMKVHKGRKRLPGWLERVVYRPLWSKQGSEWLGILPTRVFLVASSVRRRRFHVRSLQVDLSMYPEDFLYQHPGRAGLRVMRKSKTRTPK